MKNSFMQDNSLTIPLKTGQSEGLAGSLLQPGQQISSFSAPLKTPQSEGLTEVCYSQSCRSTRRPEPTQGQKGQVPDSVNQTSKYQ